MGVDCTLYLPGNVRVSDVAKVIGKLAGFKATRDCVEEHPPGFVRVNGVEVKNTENQPGCVWMEFHGKATKWSDGEFNYLYQYESSHGGDHVILARSRDFNIAIFKALADFFGGTVIYSDCGDMTPDYQVPAKSDEENQPEDGAPYWNLQQRIFDLQPLGKNDFDAAENHAAYK